MNLDAEFSADALRVKAGRGEAKGGQGGEDQRVEGRAHLLSLVVISFELSRVLRVAKHISRTESSSHDAGPRLKFFSAVNLKRLFYVSTKGTAAIGVRRQAATKRQQLKYVAVW